MPLRRLEATTGLIVIELQRGIIGLPTERRAYEPGFNGRTGAIINLLENAGKKRST